MKIVLKESIPCFQHTIPSGVELNYSVFIVRGKRAIYAHLPEDETSMSRVNIKNIKQFRKYRDEIYNKHHPDCPAVDGFGCRCDGTFLKQMK